MISAEKKFALIIFYSLIFGLLTIFSGLGLFVLDESWLQNEEELKKSFEGMLEIVAPHLFAMAIFAFVINHFLLFVEGFCQKKALKLSMFIYLLILLINLSGYFASLGFISFIWLKIFFLLLFTLSFLWVFYKISFRI